MLRFCQPSIALQLTSLGEAQASATRMVTCEIGGWTLRFDLRVVCKKLRPCRSVPGVGLRQTGRISPLIANMQQLTYASFDHWLTHIHRYPDYHYAHYIH